MKIISNTGPIIGLAKIDLLSLLKNLASEVLIPPMVHRELLAKVGPESKIIDKALKEFIRVKEFDLLDSPTEKAIFTLDEGERQAIALAATQKGDVLLLLDDRAGREIAKGLNIPTSGLMGLLLLAKGKRILNNVSPSIDELRNQGYWLSDEVVEISKRLAGEKE